VLIEVSISGQVSVAVRRDSALGTVACMDGNEARTDSEEKLIFGMDPPQARQEQ